MPTKMEKFYFNGEKILKQTLSKYDRWTKVLIAIKNGADDAESIRDRLGVWATYMLRPMKKDGMVKASSSTRVATYTITEKGEQLINDIKQYKKEKENEKI